MVAYLGVRVVEQNVFGILMELIEGAELLI